MNIWRIIYRFSWAVLTALIVIGLALVFIPKARKIAYLQDVKQHLEVRNTRKAEQIKELQIRQERFLGDPEYVEQTARESGLVTANEIVYKFTDPVHTAPHP